MLADLDRVIVPGITHWQHPGWHAYFPTGASGPSVLADLVSSGLGVQGMLWSTSPACTELETHVLDWMAELLGLPERFRSTGDGGGVIEESASGRRCARSSPLAGEPPATGRSTDLRAYTSTQAHSSIEKAVRIAGLRPEQLRMIDVDDAFALRPDALAAAMAEDRAAGLIPFFVVANVGTTSSTAARPARRRSPTPAPSTAPGSTSTPPTPARRWCARSCAGSWTGSSGPTASA